MTVRHRHYPELDGMRGAAILMVVVYHYVLDYNGAGPLRAAGVVSLAQLGWIGVDFFFVISGFLITSILLETRQSPGYLKNFLMRRTLRIWPLYYANLLVVIAIAPLVVRPLPFEVQSIVDKQGWFWAYAANWLFAQEGFNQTAGGYFWSLAVEEQFYLVWPFVVWKLSERRLTTICAAMFVGSLALRLGLASFGVPGPALYTITFTRLEPLAIGSLLALAARNPQQLRAALRWTPPVLYAAVAGLVAVRLFDPSFRFREPAMSRVGYTFIALIAGAVLAAIHLGTPPAGVAAFVRSRFMVLTGRYSYALYLLHVPIGQVFDRAFGRWVSRAASPLEYDARFIAQAFLAALLSWLLAMTSWHLFEKRILTLKRYFETPSAPVARPISPALANDDPATRSIR